LWIKTPENCGKLSFRNPQSFVEHSLFEYADETVKKERNYYLNFDLFQKKVDDIICITFVA
jgi:hypothetical protein